MADKEKFFRLLEPLLENLERFALNLARNRDTAGDIVSDTIIAAYDNFDKLKYEKAFLSYLFSIASRIYYARLKHSRRENGDCFEEAAVMFQNDLSAETRTDINILYRAIDTLDDKLREALILSELMGFRHREIAEIQNSSIAAVKIRVHRAKKKIGVLLRDRQSEAPACSGSASGDRGINRNINEFTTACRGRSAYENH